MTGGTVGKCCLVKEIQEESYINQRVALIRIQHIDIRYFYSFLLTSFVHKVINESKTSTNDNISMGLIESLLIPLPPLEEQKRIVSKLKHIEPLLNEYDLHERKLTILEEEFSDKLKKSILQYAIEGKLVKQDPNDEPASVLLERIKAEKEALIKAGKIKRDKNESVIYQGDDKNYYENKNRMLVKIDVPYSIPNGWCWIKSKQVLSNIQYGFNGAGESKGKYKLLRITDIQNNSVNWDTLPYCNIDDAKAIDYQVHPDDIFIARTGGTIGKSFRLKEAKDNTVFAGYLIRFQFIDSKLSQYFEQYLKSPLYWNEVADKSAGTGQPNINGVSLSNLFIPVPPIDEQTRILNKINKMFNILSLN